MKYVALVIAMLIPTLGLAHSMQPGFETDYAVTPTHEKTYVLENAYKFPATYEVRVYNKDFTPAEGWRVKKATWKLLPESKKRIPIQFKAEGQRKLIVCTRLIGVGKQDEKPSIISRVCSRLIINGFSG
jgi:hypothetical protein